MTSSYTAYGMLFEQADSLATRGHYGCAAAVVLYHTAVEARVDQAFIDATDGKVERGVVTEAVISLIPGMNFLDRKTQALWEALTGDRVTAFAGWAAYRESVELRNAVAHARNPFLGPDEADAASRACRAIVAHVDRIALAFGG